MNFISVLYVWYFIQCISSMASLSVSYFALASKSWTTCYLWSTIQYLLFTNYDLLLLTVYGYIFTSALTTHYVLLPCMTYAVVHSLLTTHYSPLTTHYSLLTTYHVPLSIHYLWLTMKVEQLNKSECSPMKALQDLAQTARTKLPRWSRQCSCVHCEWWIEPHDTHV